MKGQWIGACTGTNTGTVIANIDELPTCYWVVAYLLDNNFLGSAISFKTTDKNPVFEVQTNDIHPIDSNGIVSNWQVIKKDYPPGTQFPTQVKLKCSFDTDSLKISWASDIDTKGECNLSPSKANLPSELCVPKKGWNEYKAHVATLKGREHLFRGQSRSYRLRTSFHRTGRADLFRFLNEDIPTLRRHISSKVKHIFNLNNPDENGAFYNLLQHHGYPTPLLDWTYSPYVAAFFAYRGITSDRLKANSPDDCVRIYIFNHILWKKDLRQCPMLLPAFLHLSVDEYMAIENDRVIPQQSAFTLTNIDDIESYIRSKEGHGKEYLTAIDLPITERNLVMEELSYMGITAGSLLPGLDGICEELKERNFKV